MFSFCSPGGVELNRATPNRIVESYITLIMHPFVLSVVCLPISLITTRFRRDFLVD